MILLLWMVLILVVLTWIGRSISRLAKATEEAVREQKKLSDDLRRSA